MAEQSDYLMLPVRIKSLSAFSLPWGKKPIKIYLIIFFFFFSEIADIPHSTQLLVAVSSAPLPCYFSRRSLAALLQAVWIDNLLL